MTRPASGRPHPTIHSRSASHARIEEVRPKILLRSEVLRRKRGRHQAPDRRPQGSEGAVQGVASSIGSLASIIGLIIGGFLYNSIGSPTFLIAASIIFVVFALSFKILKIQKTFEPNQDHDL